MKTLWPKLTVLAALGATMASTLATPPRLRYPIPTRGLVGYWKGDGNARDSAGNHDGVLEGGMDFTQGISGQAFNAAPGRRVYIPDNPDFQLSSFTIGAWVNFQQPGYYVFFRGDNRSAMDPYAIAGDLSGNISFQITSDANVMESLSIPISYDQWHQVTGSFDARTHSLRFYLDGKLAASKTTAITPMLLLDPSQVPGLGIGNAQDFYDFPFTGGIDEVALYSRALAPNEVRTLARSRILSKAPPRRRLPAAIQPISDQVTLQIERVDSDLVLTWSRGKLLQAADRNGPWTTNESATSPYTIPATNAQKFFRVQTNP